MTSQKEDSLIVYDRDAKYVILSGSFLSEIDLFRQHLNKAIYYKNEYHVFEKEELEKPRIIQFFLSNCPGGVVQDMLAMIALLRFSKQKLPNLTFHLFCCGRIQSSATLFMVSDVFTKVTIDRHATFVIHNVELTLSEKGSFKKRRLNTLGADLEQTEKIMQKSYAESAERRKKPIRDWQEIIDGGNDKADFDAQDILYMGLCDEIL